MYMKVISLFLILLMINISSANLVFAGDRIDAKLSKKEAKIKKKADKVKEGVIKLGVGKDSLVKIKLRDKTKIKGYISQINETNFVVVDEAGNGHIVEYKNTKQIKGNNLHAGVWVAIGVGIGIAIVFIVVAIGLRNGS